MHREYLDFQDVKLSFNMELATFSASVYRKGAILPLGESFEGWYFIADGLYAAVCTSKSR
jgi:hypothetical protein